MNKLWAMRKEFDLRIDEPEQLVKIGQVAVPQCLYGFEVIHDETIPSDDGDFDVAGIFDRRAKEIHVSRRFPLPQRRLTLAHEVCHLVLHPGRVYHRDRPIQGGEQLEYKRPVIEREADLFGAELLMPTKLLTPVFYRYFGGRICCEDTNEDMCYWLSQGTGNRITPKQFKSMRPFERAMIVAGSSSFGTTFFSPLTERFSVSKTAMAIQLWDLGLVT